MILNLPDVTHPEGIGSSFSSHSPEDNFSETQNDADGGLCRGQGCLSGKYRGRVGVVVATFCSRRAISRGTADS